MNELLVMTMKRFTPFRKEKKRGKCSIKKENVLRVPGPSFVAVDCSVGKVEKRGNAINANWRMRIPCSRVFVHLSRYVPGSCFVAVDYSVGKVEKEEMLSM